MNKRLNGVRRCNTNHGCPFTLPATHTTLSPDPCSLKYSTRKLFVNRMSHLMSSPRRHINHPLRTHGLGEEGCAGCEEDIAPHFRSALTFTSRCRFRTAGDQTMAPLCCRCPWRCCPGGPFPRERDSQCGSTASAGHRLCAASPQRGLRPGAASGCEEQRGTEGTSSQDPCALQPLQAGTKEVEGYLPAPETANWL